MERKFKVVEAESTIIFGRGDILTLKEGRGIFYFESKGMSFGKVDNYKSLESLIEAVEEHYKLEEITPSMLEVIANYYNLELNEEFHIVEGINNPYKLTEDGLYNKEGKRMDYTLGAIINGKYTIEKLPEKRTIIIDNKEIELSEESYQEFVKQFK